jgi:hypothetical protein
MELKEFKQYTKNLHAYSAEEVEELQPMTPIELEQYQHEVERDTGNLSDWDHVRAIITFKKRIRQLESQLTELVSGIYEHANEGTFLMELAERIDEME